MKCGPMGVRECDVSGCHMRWPCVMHGTLTVGSKQPQPIRPVWPQVSPGDLMLCGVCRHHVCRCARGDSACRRCGYDLCHCGIVNAPTPMPKTVLVGFQVGDVVECVRPDDYGPERAQLVRGRTLTVSSVGQGGTWLSFEGVPSCWEASRFAFVRAAPELKREWRSDAQRPGESVLRDSRGEIYARTFRSSGTWRVAVPSGHGNGGAYVYGRYDTEAEARSYGEQLLDEHAKRIREGA